MDKKSPTLGLYYYMILNHQPFIFSCPFTSHHLVDYERLICIWHGLSWHVDGEWVAARFWLLVPNIPRNNPLLHRLKYINDRHQIPWVDDASHHYNIHNKGSHWNLPRSEILVFSFDFLTQDIWLTTWPTKLPCVDGVHFIYLYFFTGCLVSRGHMKYVPPLVPDKSGYCLDKWLK